MTNSPIITKLSALTTIVVLSVGSAWAANPHFFKNKVTASLETNGAVTVAFKEAGLGDNELIEYVAEAFAEATFACQNNGGNFPQDPKKEQVFADVEASGIFPSSKNGQVQASLTIQPPQSTLDCPPGQNEVLVELAYSDIRITDTTNGVTQVAVPSAISVQYLELP